jgi:predicted nucleic acid-binding protein
VDNFVVRLAELPLTIDDATDAGGMVLLHGMSRLHRVGIFDAAYLELALRTGLPLATRDEPLAEAARRLGARTFEASPTP